MTTQVLRTPANVRTTSPAPYQSAASWSPIRVARKPAITAGSARARYATTKTAANRADRSFDGYPRHPPHTAPPRAGLGHHGDCGERRDESEQREPIDKVKRIGRVLHEHRRNQRSDAEAQDGPGAVDE